MSANYDFVVDLALRHVPPPASLLDFGCGGGEIVGKALAAGYDAIGVDTYEDVWTQYAHAVEAAGGRIRRVAPGQPLPFPDAAFDLVVHNQVMEHLADPAGAIAEMARVLRPDGVMIVVFPTAEVIVEPHLKLPLVHWLAAGSPAQRRALHLAHAAGLHPRGLGDRREWVRFQVESLRQRIFYRPRRAYEALFAPAFQLEARAGADYLRFRLARAPGLRHLSPLFRPRALDLLLDRLCLRLAGAVLVLRRR